MAAMSRSAEGERGQLILVGALILAVTFVGLALIVNSAIYTENIATRGDVPGSDDALEYRYEVTQSVGGIVEFVNRYNNTDQGTLEGNTEDSIINLTSQGGLQQSSLGRVVTVEYPTDDDDVDFGNRIAQDEPANFTNETAADDWTVVEDVEDVRNFQINVTDPENLDDPFILRANDTSGEAWVMEVEGDTDEITVTVDPSDTAIDPETCTRSFDEGSMQIDITGGTVAGESCHALSQQSDGTSMWFASDLDEFDIEFENGGNIEGTYSFVTRDATAINTEYTPAIYSLVVHYQYDTPRVEYKTEVRVAPGEIPS